MTAWKRYTGSSAPLALLARAALTVPSRSLGSALLASAVTMGAYVEHAEASLVEAMDLDMLVSEAEQVVVARVMSLESRYDARGQIVTDVAMQVEEALKGDAAPGSALVVRRLGGEVGDVGMRVSGEPTFEVGETVVLFGAHIDGNATLRPLGMAQGALRVFEKDGERWARSAGAGMSAVRRSGGKLRNAPLAVAEPRRLVELTREIRTLAAKARQAP